MNKRLVLVLMAVILAVGCCPDPDPMVVKAHDAAERYFGIDLPMYVYVLSQEETEIACRQDNIPGQVAGCAIVHRIIVSEEADLCQASLHEFGHSAAWILDGDPDADHKKYDDFFFHFVFEECENIARRDI